MDFLLQNLKTIIWSVFGAIFLIVVIKNYSKIVKFLLEVKAELSKVSWSSRQELVASTIVVIVVTAIMALFIGVVDLALSKILSLLFR